MNVPPKTVFYTIERTIKSYRKFSNRNFSRVVDDITVDQKLILQYLNSSPELSQTEIAELVFKDTASITRMIDLMVKKDFLKRSINTEDRRKFKLEITAKGKDILSRLEPVIAANRKTAFAGISEEELIQLDRTLQKILSNIT
ncbi:MarR family winged helix-turn-helix transcriptional regulator [Robertkochia solimangrovi]|uniref:MarR family winged helix-turn-helix transcriptional regulator n=1 Tax=Robertkochia solimangrovi TaxID=2213046 RepID=UPI00117BE418|nr:MarR family transcriptional regulator [Robertkochia solimangrovi]TRZ42423.1 MarR family transcriptional regulator [Robertkochia solimangrovi]